MNIHGSTDECTVSYLAPKTSSRAEHHGILNTSFLNCRRCQHCSFCRLRLLITRPPPPTSARLHPSPGCLDVPPNRPRPPPLGSAPHRAFFDRRSAAPQGAAAASPPRTGCPDVVSYLATANVFFYLNLSECG
jgi:hypothetical protein